MSAYDGSIKFDTSIDSKGFNHGLKAISKSMFNVLKPMSDYFSRIAKESKIFAEVFTGGWKTIFKIVGGVAKILGTIVTVIGTIIGVAAALALIAVAAGIAIFAWAQKFTNTLFKSLAVTSAYRDKVVELKTAFDTLKGAMMGLGMTILSAIAPAIMTVINWLVKAINYVSMFIAALTGQKQVMQYVSGSAEGAANSAGKLAKNTDKAGKAAKGALAAFDQLNVLQMQEPQDESGGGGGSGGNMVYKPVPIDPKILEFVEKIRKAFSDAWDWIKQAAIDTWSWIVNVWSVASEWFITKVWTPIATWFVENVIRPLRLKFEELKIYLTDFWQSVMQPAIDWIVNNVWPIFQWIGEKLWGLLTIVLPANFQFLWGVIKSVFTWVVDLFKNVWVTITGVFKGIMTVIEGIIEFLTGIFTGNWTKAWEGIKRIFKGIWESIVAMSTGFVNLIIDTINFMIRAIVSGVNAAISALNKLQVKIPEWVPTYGGSTWGINIPSLTAPQIPRLATGAVIPPNSQFLAVLGDNKRENEILAPESTLSRLIQEAIGNSGGGSDAFLPITLLLDGEVIYQNQQRIQRQRGTSLLAGGAA